MSHGPLVSAVSLLVLVLTVTAFGGDRLDLASREFVFEAAPVPSCHASTVVELNDGLLTAWFGGSQEGANDVSIWASRKVRAEAWSKPVEVADGVDHDGHRYPCWNPVLFELKDEVLLFYKVGPSPSRWWGVLKRSRDDGQTWSKDELLPDGIYGPIKNKPVLLTDGLLVSGSSTEHRGWWVHFERTTDDGQTWSRSGPTRGEMPVSAIQPALLVHGPLKLQMLCRTREKRIYDSWSEDGGVTWSALKPTELPNPNSGLDAVTLKDGRHVVIYNHTEQGRSPLNLAISRDGKTWTPGPVLESEPGEYSYPAIIQTTDGRLHATWTWKRQKIAHAVLKLGEGSQ